MIHNLIFTKVLLYYLPKPEIGKYLQGGWIMECGEPFYCTPSGLTLNYRYFAEQIKQQHRIIWDPQQKSFFRYNPERGIYEKKNDQGITKITVETMDRFVMNFPDKQDVLQAKISIRFLDDVRKMLCCICETNFSVTLDAPQRIHLLNTVLEYATGENHWKQREFSPDHLSRNQIPIKYDPQAKCRTFLDKLLIPAISYSDIELLQQYVGQCLLGKNITQTFLILTGTPGGGKSTLANVIEGLIGRWNCTELRTEFLNNRFEISRTLGKTLLTAKDVPGDFLSTRGAQRLKALVGNDMMTLEYKNRNDALDIPGNFNVIITSNDVLRLRFEGDEDAWRRRLLWIPYERPPVAEADKIAEFDRLLLETEGSGILNWALEGATKLLEAEGKLARNAEQQKRIESLIDSSSPVDSFVRRFIEPNPYHNLSTAEATFHFQQYCDLMKWPQLPERQIMQLLPDAMRRIHQAVKRHDLKGPQGRMIRGYKNFHLLTLPI